jgi:hypothetical protein
MRKFIFILVIFSADRINAQLRIEPTTKFLADGPIVLVFENTDLVNDGVFTPGNSLVKFTGNTNNHIGGLSTTGFHELAIGKSPANKLILQKNITVTNRIIFNSGLIDLNLRDIDLGSQAYLDNESETSRIMGAAGGSVYTTLMMNAPVAVNAGNLGAHVTSASNMGSVIVKRGHKTPAGTGMVPGINRYFEITPTNNVTLNATLRFNYFTNELNNLPENTLNMYRSSDAGINWINEGFTVRNEAQNYLEKSAINSFSRWALSAPGTDLQPIVSPGPQGLNFPVAGSSRDFILSVQNNLNMLTSGQVIVRIIKLSAFIYTIPLTNGITNGDPVQNGDWIIDDSNAAFVVFTLKPGVNIPGFGSSNIGITVSRNQGVAANTTQNLTMIIQNGTGGDAVPANNTSSAAVTAQ